MVFQNKTVPERQQIDVDIDVHTVEIHKKYRNNPQLYYEFMGHSGMMTFRISHTSRTWGSDIENLLSGHMKGLLIPEDKTLRSVVSKKISHLAMEYCSSFRIFGSVFGAHCWLELGSIS